jgi:hypothetical protein
MDAMMRANTSYNGQQRLKTTTKTTTRKYIAATTMTTTTPLDPQFLRIRRFK